jgi:hypothetical protein
MDLPGGRGSRLLFLYCCVVAFGIFLFAGTPQNEAQGMSASRADAVLSMPAAERQAKRASLLQLDCRSVTPGSRSSTQLTSETPALLLVRPP